MLIYAMVGRLTLHEFGEGPALVALCCVLAAAQSTNNLVIRVKGTKKPYVFAFSTISLNRKYPAVTHAQLNAVAGRINDLAMEARTQASTRRSAHSEFPPPSPNSNGVGLHAAAFECADSR